MKRPDAKTVNEAEALVVFIRLHLYNAGAPCGPKAIAAGMEEHLAEWVPALSTIAGMLARNHLTHGRTGDYDEDPCPSWLPQSARR